MFVTSDVLTPRFGTLNVVRVAVGMMVGVNQVKLSRNHELYCKIVGFHTCIVRALSLPSALPPEKRGKNSILHHCVRTECLIGLVLALNSFCIFVTGILCSRWSTLWGIMGWKISTNT